MRCFHEIFVKIVFRNFNTHTAQLRRMFLKYFSSWISLVPFQQSRLFHFHEKKLYVVLFRRKFTSTLKYRFFFSRNEFSIWVIISFASRWNQAFTTHDVWAIVLTFALEIENFFISNICGRVKQSFINVFIVVYHGSFLGFHFLSILQFLYLDS